MRKILTIAAREYRAMVGTKAFLISIIMMPVLMFAGILAMELLKDVGQTKVRKLAIVDHAGVFFDKLDQLARQQAEAREESAGDPGGSTDQDETAAADGDRDTESDSADDSPTGSEKKKRRRGEDIPGVGRETYELEQFDAATFDDEARLKLSERIRDQELYAFVEIPAAIIDPESAGDQKIGFYSEDSSISVARRWVQEAVSGIARQTRIQKSGLKPSEIERFQQINRGAQVVGHGLIERDASGSISVKEEKDLMMSLFLPMGIMMLMFMVIFMASQPMLESVLEEKSQRIAEVLLGSANPTQLMMGKLLGTVAGSLTIFAIYVLGIYAIAEWRDWTENIPFEIVPWFIVFQITGVLFYAAIFMSVGASVSQLKEAQSMLLPVWMLLMTPMFVWFMIVRDPQGPMALALSFFPPTAPTTMVLRMATGQSIPIWQPIVALLATLIATVVIVILAGRIFRVGILWQGKTPKISEIVKWAIVGE